MDVNRKPTLSNYEDDGKDTVGITKNLSNKTIAVNGHFRLIGTFLGVGFRENDVKFCKLTLSVGRAARR